MKQTITYLRVSGHRVCAFIKKLLGKGAHHGSLKIGVTIGFPPLFSVSVSYDVGFQGKADNDNKKAAKTG